MLWVIVKCFNQRSFAVHRNIFIWGQISRWVSFGHNFWRRKGKFMEISFLQIQQQFQPKRHFHFFCINIRNCKCVGKLLFYINRTKSNVCLMINRCDLKGKSSNIAFKSLLNRIIIQKETSQIYISYPKYQDVKTNIVPRSRHQIYSSTLNVLEYFFLR